jgi:membrane-associated phospholipid phosphatase
MVLSQIGLVAGIELGDDLLHAQAPQANAAAGLADALRVASFEQRHGFWIEPGLQRFFAGNHQLLGLRLGWAQVHPLVNALYGPGHVLFTLAFALWVYAFRRPLFSFVRDVFLLTTMLAVCLYEAFPLAPPRLAQGLHYQGRPYHFLDAVFGGGGVKLSFNEYAAMPSLHVAWALIVGLVLAWAARPRVVRLLGAVYPLVMLTTVVVTGNHYLLDGIGALLVVTLSSVLAMLIAWRRTRAASLAHALRSLHGLRSQGVGTRPAVAAQWDAPRVAA